MTTTANVMTVHDNFMNLTLHDLSQKQKAIMQKISKTFRKAIHRGVMGQPIIILPLSCTVPVSGPFIHCTTP
jgi:hypothetical protein